RAARACLAARAAVGRARQEAHAGARAVGGSGRAARLAAPSAAHGAALADGGAGAAVLRIRIEIDARAAALAHPDGAAAAPRDAPRSARAGDAARAAVGVVRLEIDAGAAAVGLARIARRRARSLGAELAGATGVMARAAVSGIARQRDARAPARDPP